MTKGLKSDLREPLLDKEIKQEAQITEIITLDSFLNSQDFAKLIMPFLGWKTITAVASVNNIWLKESQNSKKHCAPQDETAMKANALNQLKNLISNEHTSKLEEVLNNILNQLNQGKNFQDVLIPLELSTASVENRVWKKVNSKTGTLGNISLLTMALCSSTGIAGAVALLVTLIIFLDKGKDLSVLEIPAIVFGGLFFLGLLGGCICIKPLDAWEKCLKEKIRPLEYKIEIKKLEEKKLTPEKTKLELVLRQLIWLKNNPHPTSKSPSDKKEEKEENRKLSSKQSLLVSTGKSKDKNKTYLSTHDHVINLESFNS